MSRPETSAQPDDKEPDDKAEAFKQALRASARQLKSADPYSGGADPQPGSAAQFAQALEASIGQLDCYWCRGRLEVISLQDYLSSSSDAPGRRCNGCGGDFIGVSHLVVCSRVSCRTPYHDRRCAESEPPARIPAEIPKTKVKCLYCENEISQDDKGTFTEKVMRCSWFGCSGYKYFYHSECLAANGAPQHCQTCQRYMLDEVRSIEDEPIPNPREFEEQVRSAIWQDGHGVTQEDNLCYAAATATACHCAGMPGITLLECMHLFITTDRCQALCKKEYLEAFARTKTPGEPASVTLEKMKIQCPDTMKAATTILGEPVFPAGFGATYLPQIGDAELMQAIRDGKVVMAGESSHWLVIIGFRTDNGQLRVEVFDPGSGDIKLVTWSAAKYRDFYTVG